MALFNSVDQLTFRRAKEVDLQIIVDLLANDPLGKARENTKNIPAYKKAFLEIADDKNNFLAVVEFDAKLIATCHLTLMPSLTMQGSKRMNIEGVRVADEFKNKGIGSWMIKRAIEFARENDAKIIQLTTNKIRSNAQNFYHKLGFASSHEGMKLKL